MTQIIKYYGVPGTGKTTTLTRLAVEAAHKVGPDRLCAVTYTRAGADELKGRIATALNITAPADAWARRRYLDERMPWIGTIHSIAWKLIGRPALVKDKLADFVKAQGGNVTGLPDQDELEGYTWAEPDRDEVQAALAVHAAARNRMMSIAEVWPLMPWGIGGPPVSPGRAERIAQQYEDFKRQIGRIDFEDMLSMAIPEMGPAVDVVLADEVQDNSRLLWSVVDHWAEDVRFYIMAGDPYQAIYLFSGAEPSLYIDHPGRLISLGNSHRLTPESAERAQRVLRLGGHVGEGWLDTWAGQGSGAEQDGSVFWLARTGKLLMPIERDLQAGGTPYGYTRGGGPLSYKAAAAVRSLARLREREAITIGELALIADQSDKVSLPYGEKARLIREAKANGEEIISLDQVRARGWHHDPTGVNMGIKRGAYYERVYARHGIAAFLPSYTPLVKVGTIHSAKGREADVTNLIASWATLPYRSATGSLASRQAEACVAYVGVTRHRVKLNLVTSYEGIRYPGL